MATINNLVQTYSQKGQAEDFEDMIYNVVPWETPVLTAIGRGKASGKFHKWQIDALASPGANAQVEGDDISSITAISATTEVGNHLQISYKVVGVTGTMEVVDKYGRTSEMSYQMAKKAKELKTDIDYSICQNQKGTVGATNAARTSGGMEAWIQTNQQSATTTSTTTSSGGYQSGGTIEPGSGEGATTGAFTEANFKSLITTIWNASTGNPDLIAMAGVNKAVMSTSSFAGIATRFRDVGAGQKAQIISGVDLYVSDFGTHKLVPSRQMRTRTILALNTDYWATAYLRPFTTTPLAKTGDHERKMLLAEWTLVSRNEKSSGKLVNLSGS